MERVLFVGEKSKDLTRLANLFAKKKCQVETLPSFSQALQATKEKLFQLMICWPADAGDRELLAAIQVQCPNFPILVISQSLAGLNANIYCEVHQPSLDDEGLLARARSLIHLGKMRQQLQESELKEQCMRKFVSQVDLTCSSDMINKASQLLAEITGSDNVVWISTFYLFCPQLTAAGDVKALSRQALSKNLDTFSLKPLSGFSELVKIVESATHRGSIWQLEKEKICVLPMRNLKDTGRVGYFYLLQPQRIPSFLEEFIWNLENRLAFAYEYEAACELSYVDDLTKLYNQRYLPMVLEQEMNRSDRENRKFSILFLDVDYFKHVNDNNGHLVGSQVLIQISEIIRQCTRSYDYGFRYGGDEFVVILPGTDVLNSKQIAERIREQVQSATFRFGKAEVRLTVSIGIATFPDHAKSPQQVLELADRAMYYGKNTSRNIVYIAS